jgi:hypothetical protein
LILVVDLEAVSAEREIGKTDLRHGTGVFPEKSWNPDNNGDSGWSDSSKTWFSFTNLGSNGPIILPIEFKGVLQETNRPVDSVARSSDEKNTGNPEGPAKFSHYLRRVT